MDVHPLKLKVRSYVAETPFIRSLVFGVEDGVVPQWQAGAHLRVALPNGGDRPYSLMALPGLPEDALALGVLREEASSGGSQFMHALKVGDIVKASAPVNNFRLHEGAAPALLFAGGIGITPVLSMAAELAARGSSYRLHYAGRTQGLLAFLPQLQEICAGGLSVHYDSDESRLDIAAALGDAAANAHVYVCGPSGMIDAVKAAAAAAGVSTDRVHYELFKSEQPSSPDQPFEVEIKSTGQVVGVAAGQTIIEALEAAGFDVLYDCRRGDCGICQCGVIAGLPDHRDVILSDEERASNKVMQICVSRAKSERLVLDL
ncbi:MULTISPECIES: PDR/VanB family oxidoreductase [unclassified Bradyrhizobium]|uniref:PDR/VanB family oxidoreductase n=1 Tax=unclassified Bradyrhizobium TaxID=2631580 RepID=UPI001CD34839|nr:MULTISPECIES: PDR/VanB family oxidoreductase [unclassified Bradyrhizobium]MCA1372823.1 oxidoreductase [Bradyrhizobium sp. IC4060]MCA1487936.1 oxidoreductase [Bradyrhizobium sp. IC4061]MCA1540582.1 oxidoreductase [Bradyrhizobium sp. NBAIM32]